MTTLAGLLLTVIALTIIAYPLVQRPLAARGRRSGDALADLGERYRSALADLQDVEADWEIGNLSEADYARLRDEHRLRAAQSLRALAQHEARREQVRAELLRYATGRPAPAPSSPGSNGAGHKPEEVATALQAWAAADRDAWPARPAQPPARPRRPARLPAPVLVGAATAAVALAGIGLLYLHAAGLQAAQAPLATLPIAHAHTVLVDEAGTYWVGHHDGLLRSADGRSWRPVVPQGDIMAIVSDPSRLLLFGHEVMLESTDGGASWTVASHDLPDADVHGAQRGILGIYAYVEGRGLFRSTDGRHWEQSSDPVAPGVGGLAVVPAADGGDAVFLAAAGTVLRTADGGRTWAAAAGAGNAALTGTVRSLAGDAGGGALYAATTDGLFRSTSRGADWVKLPFRGSLAAVGARGAQVAVVDDRGQFFRSRDGGGAWTAEP